LPPADLDDWLTPGAGGDQARWVEERVVVVGAGPAGLAAGWAIRRAGVDPLIVERRMRSRRRGGPGTIISG
jgi:NADPH-dependent glutamate synthase beta subunit-like oxidoreductase